VKSTEALQMKVNFKINTLRGIFFCLTRNKDGLCPRTVFSQTQKIKNVCLKRRFQFVERRYKLKTPALLLGKSQPISALLQPANTFPPALIFAREQKCIINHSGLDFQRRNGSD